MPVFPRPGQSYYAMPPVPAPSESSFTNSFGKVLPPVQYFEMDSGRAAYYSIPPVAQKASNATTAPDRVLFIHGIQTCAIDMLPLAQALHFSFLSSHFVLFDLWGHGLSEAPFQPYEASLFHLIIDKLLDYLKWPTAHLLGYAFGGALAVGYVALRPQRVSSYTLVAPAGLFRRSELSAEQQACLSDEGDEKEVLGCVLGILEGGPVAIPSDWKERVARGEVVAEAVRAWQMVKHTGHAAAVVAMFRDGGLSDNEASFVAAVGTGVKNMVVLGELDGIVGKEQLADLGFKDVHVVKEAGHGLVRERVPEVKALVEEFWRSL